MRSIVLALCAAVLLAGCGEFGVQNEPPRISDILVNPDVATPSDTVELTAVATDPEGDEIRYRWSSGEGRIENAPPYTRTTNPARWIAPATTGEYEITCEVRDSTSSSIQTVTVAVQ